jgi:hypothetical protein
VTPSSRSPGKVRWPEWLTPILAHTGQWANRIHAYTRDGVSRFGEEKDALGLNREEDIFGVPCTMT